MASDRNRRYGIHFQPTPDILILEVLRRRIQGLDGEIPSFVISYFNEIGATDFFTLPNYNMEAPYTFCRKGNFNRRDGEWINIKGPFLLFRNNEFCGSFSTCRKRDTNIRVTEYTYYAQPQPIEQIALYHVSLTGSENPPQESSNAFGIVFDPTPEIIILKILRQWVEFRPIPAHVWCYSREVHRDSFFTLSNFQRRGNLFVCRRAVNNPSTAWDIVEGPTDVFLNGVVAGNFTQFQKRNTNIRVIEYRYLHQENNELAIYRIVSRKFCA